MKARVNDRFEYTLPPHSDIKIRNRDDDRYEIEYEGKTVVVDLLKFDPRKKYAEVGINGFVLKVQLEDELDMVVKEVRQHSVAVSEDVIVTAPIPGLIKTVNQNGKSSVEEGDQLLVLEAMKMENTIQAPVSAVRVIFHVEPGDRVVKGQKLCTLFQDSE